MVSLRDEITAAAQTLNLTSDEFRTVAGEERQHLLDDVIRRYVRQPNARWWWEAFRCRCLVVSFPGAIWGHWLSRLVESPQNHRVWFIAGVEDDDPVLYETTVTTAEAVLDECYLFEYYIAAHDLSWLAGENHHSTRFALGFRLMRRLLTYMRDHPEEASRYYVPPRRT